MSESFPRQQARTRRFTLGAPRTFHVSEDGSRVVFLRSRAGDDPVTCLWVLDVASGEERLLVDPAGLGADDGELPAAERARRERARESAGGIVTFAVGGPQDALASFALGGVPHVVDLHSGDLRAGEGVGAFDVRVDPTGSRVGYVADGALRIWSLDDGTDLELLTDDDPDVSWGTAEFVAAEEMGRTRGYWWAPDGSALAAARVDVSGVDVWWLADPTEPASQPRSMRYPAAGTANARVELAVVDVSGEQVAVAWDDGGYEYLADVLWDAERGLHVLTAPRDQRSLALRAVDPATGTVATVHTIEDEHWVELVDGMPTWVDGSLVTVEERDDTRSLCLDGEAVSGSDLWVRRVVGPYLGGVVFTASPDPSEVHVYRWTPAGVEQLTAEPGVHDARVGGPTMVLSSSVLDDVRRRHVVRSGAVTHAIDDHSERPVIDPVVRLHRCGPDRIPTAVLFPTDDPGGPLPVLLDPYGGPHAQRVLASAMAHTASQWFADQGFVVVVADGRGTPGRSSSWERAVHGDLAGPVLDDQIAALDAVDHLHPGRLDRGRVAIRGWSFGGYLAALAVLARPDVFHAAVAGAPVTDWRLYDTHYTERYLGHPDDHPGNYERTSLLPLAPRLERPLMLIHGLADDNVVAAHTLQLSRALMHAGRPHQVLPLAGVSHMTPQEEVAENLLRLQVAFLRRALGLGA